VPTPRPTSRATFTMPSPFASSRRACSILSGSAPGRPSFLRILPALETKFELGEGARHLEQQLARRRGGVDVLLIQAEIDADLLEVLNRAEQVDQRSAEPIIGRRHTTSNLRRLASLSMASSPGRLSLPLEPLMPASR
jgi:hypothetical protein